MEHLGWPMLGRLRITAALGFASAAGCTTEAVPPPEICSQGDFTCRFDASTEDASSDADADGTEGAPDGTTAKRLPCEIQALFFERCGDCHGADNIHPAPMKLSTWDDLHVPAPSDGARKVYEMVASRVTSENTPMPPPPYPMLGADERSLLLGWVEEGAPARVDPNQRCDGDLPRDGGSEGEDDGGSGQPVNPDTNTYKSLEQSGGPEDCEIYWELRAHGKQVEYDKTPFKVNGQLGNGGNQYYCFYFKPPYGAGDQALWFAPLIDKSKILHHWLLYGTDSLPLPSGSSAPCSAAEPGAYLLAGWAPGAGETAMPPDVGLQMPAGPVGGLILELHYFNQTDESLEDSTGVKFCTIKPGKRTHDAAVHFTGGENICLPPNQGSTVKGDCYPTYNGQDIHILNVWPHMHTLGRRMEVNIVRANGAREVLHNEVFDFNNQISYPKDVVLKPGDRMETICHYENTTSMSIPFGEKTQTEMCYAFVTAWPAGSLTQNPATFGIEDWFGLPIQPTRRCLKPASILGSCNGLLDYPVPR